jgi:hypothetical protein
MKSMVYMVTVLIDIYEAFISLSPIQYSLRETIAVTGSCFRFVGAG